MTFSLLLSDPPWRFGAESITAPRFRARLVVSSCINWSCVLTLDHFSNQLHKIMPHSSIDVLIAFTWGLDAFKVTWCNCDIKMSLMAAPFWIKVD